MLGTYLWGRFTKAKFWARKLIQKKGYCPISIPVSPGTDLVARVSLILTDICLPKRNLATQSILSWLAPRSFKAYRHWRWSILLNTFSKSRHGQQEICSTAGRPPNPSRNFLFPQTVHHLTWLLILISVEQNIPILVEFPAAESPIWPRRG